MRGFLGVLLIAGCNPTSGVQINVAPIANVSEVRLYIGTGNPTTIDPSSPLAIPGEQKLVGAYFERDASFDDELVAVGTDQTAQFVFTGSGAIDALIAVGYDHGTPIAVATHFGITLPSDHFDLYDLPLAKATLPGTPSTLQLEVWDARADLPATKANCVGVQDKTTAADAQFPQVYIVNPGDPDCDGVTGDQECPGDDLTYFGQQPLQRGQRDQLDCAIVSAGQCMLGGPPCIDAPRAADPALCAPAPYCAPNDLCACPTAGLDCDSSPAAAAVFATGIQCQVPTQINIDDLSKLDLCPAMAQVDLSPVISHSASCSGPAIYDPMGRVFVDDLTTGPVESSVMLTNNCGLTIKILGGLVPEPVAGQVLASGLVIVEVDGSNNTRNNGLALPVQLVKAGGGGTCATNTTMSCSLRQAGGGNEFSRLLACTGTPAIGSE